MDQAMNAVQTQNGEPLIATLIKYGIYENEDEMLAEFRAGQDPHDNKFGTEEAFYDFIKRTRSDWIAMLQLIADGNVKNGAEARTIYYGEMNAILLLRERARGLRKKYSDTLKSQKPR